MRHPMNTIFIKDFVDKNNLGNWFQHYHLRVFQNVAIIVMVLGKELQ
jgi:hypothetical protein